MDWMQRVSEATLLDIIHTCSSGTEEKEEIWDEVLQLCSDIISDQALESSVLYSRVCMIAKPVRRKVSRSLPPALRLLDSPCLSLYSIDYISIDMPYSTVHTEWSTITLVTHPDDSSSQYHAPGWLGSLRSHLNNSVPITDLVVCSALLFSGGIYLLPLFLLYM